MCRSRQKMKIMASCCARSVDVRLAVFRSRSPDVNQSDPFTKISHPMASSVLRGVARLLMTSSVKYVTHRPVI